MSPESELLAATGTGAAGEEGEVAGAGPGPEASDEFPQPATLIASTKRSNPAFLSFIGSYPFADYGNQDQPFSHNQRNGERRMT
jgi:hypothetical protein